jgi:hypothetical protein
MERVTTEERKKGERGRRERGGRDAKAGVKRETGKRKRQPETARK